MATDGGRQLDDTSESVAASAAFTHEGTHSGRRLDANGEARSSYETELQALIDVLEEWPDTSRGLIAIDARSPVQAIIKFRVSHVNKRSEYHCDDMLD